MRRYHHIQAMFSLAAVSILLSVSCEGSLSTDRNSSLSNGTSIKVNVPEAKSFAQTKSADALMVPTRVFGSEEDDFVIEEYVGRIDDTMDQPVTKGSEMTTTAINTPGKSFTVDGWGMVSESKGKTEVATNHLPKLTSTYNGSSWAWAGGAEPKWVNESNLHIWSYYPSGKINPEITFDDSTPANNTASFTSYTTDNTDLLLAYNKEKRTFKTDAKGNHTYNAEGEITDEMTDGQSETFDIRFYHALTKVKFELGSTTSGADIHSITLCYVNGSKQIVTTEGIATTGDCVATGSGTGTGSVSFDWDNLSNRKPLHFEYSSGFDGEALFMIPQEVKNIKIIIEFSKFGSTQYYTKIQNLPNVTWSAGYYYTYKIKIGEFHVPGEKLHQLTSLTIANLKYTGSSGGSGSGTYAFKRPETSPGSEEVAPIPIKNVTKMGLVINGYSLPAKVGETVYMYSNAFATDNSLSAPGDGFSFDFAPVTLINDNMYSFGNGSSETYYDTYTFAKTGDHSESLSDAYLSGTKYYVFDTNNKDSFFLYFRPSASTSSGSFMINLLGLMVVEVKKDTNIPTNFPLTTWP